MPAPKDILRLVEQFDRNADAYRSPGYNETQLRCPLDKAHGRSFSTSYCLPSETRSEMAGMPARCRFCMR
jgi:hypothetical protein